MRIGYGELIGGLSGDMFAGALIDAGLSLRKLDRELRKIPGLRFELRASTRTVHGVRARRLSVTPSGKQPPRSWRQIRTLIGRSRLAPECKATALEIFSRLAAAEGKIHGVPPDQVHFHEIGAADSIVDIVAAAVGCRELGLGALHFSSVPLGSGLARSAHGPLPAPAPATLELLKGVPTYGVSVAAETVTPTGAAILRVLGQSFGRQPGMTIEKIGYGAGRQDFAERPNLFRLLVGEGEPPWTEEEMLVIETNIDDMNPEFYDYVFDRLFAAGARDVFLSPLQMKKNRPATLLRVLAEPSKREALARVLFRETSTIGLRCYLVGRLALRRSTAKVRTRYGPVRVKIVDQPDGEKRATPEYDDLKRIAAARHLPLKLLYDEAMRAIEKSGALAPAGDR
ncbi:MAG TPA: nickel pincer cofactor biosynthesis protein LarC [candidate division Zixibacteria bacterium]|nr:nickel pincer cofactor biosynthesis protein LarC [candidate division Zixibacteria bacterium]